MNSITKFIFVEDKHPVEGSVHVQWTTQPTLSNLTCFHSIKGLKMYLIRKINRTELSKIELDQTGQLAKLYIV